MAEMTLGAVEELVSRTYRATAGVRLMWKVRRLLVNRNPGEDAFNYTGVYLPPPFQQTNLALRTMVNEPNRVVNHYKSRLSSNQPDVAVIPLTTKTSINKTAEKMAGSQERFDNQMWIENGGKDALGRLATAMSLGGKGYLVTMPRDATFGLPDRIYYSDLTDDDIALMKREGKITRIPVVHPRTGEMVYAEPGDVWAARRKEVAKNRPIAGRSLFTLQAFPADMVVCDRDLDGLKWAAVVQEIPGDAVAEGSDLGQAWARTNRPMDDWTMPWGIFTDKSGNIVGGLSVGGPAGTEWHRESVYTLVQFYTRTEYLIYCCAQGSVEGGTLIWRGQHDCTVQGVPACPVEEIKFYDADTDVPGEDCSTPVSDVMAYAALANQVLTVASNATMFNGIPRWVIELDNGSTLRGEDGEPIMVHSNQTPGLDPSQAAAYPGKLVQLTIQTEDLLKLVEIYLERLKEALPAPVTTGAAGTSGAAWTANLLINQAQTDLIQPSEHICEGVKKVVQRWHGWERQLDTPIYFFPAPGERKNRRDIRSLVEFDPTDLTDSIEVTQDLDTPEEATVRLQMGIELLTAGPHGTPLISLEEFFDRYAKHQDARQAVIDYWVEQVVGAVMGGVPAAPGSVVQMVADGVRGQLHLDLLATSPNYALSTARGMAQQAQMQAQGQGQPQIGQPTDQQGNVAQAAGVSRPGMGMAPTLTGQVGSRFAPQNAPPGVTR